MIITEETGTVFYRSVSSACECLGICKAVMYRALNGNGELPGRHKAWVDYACEDYDVEDETEEM